MLNYTRKQKEYEFEKIKTILEAKGNPNKIDHSNGSSSFHFICEGSNIGKDLINHLLKNNANPNLKNYFDLTPFHSFCSNQKLNTDVLKFFLENNADSEAQDLLDKDTPYLVYCKNNSICLEGLKIFLNHFRKTKKMERGNFFESIFLKFLFSQKNSENQLRDEGIISFLFNNSKHFIDGSFLVKSFHFFFFSKDSKIKKRNTVG